MAMFDYVCKNEQCGHTYPVIQNGNQLFSRRCPICDAPGEKKEVQLPAKTRVGKYGKAGGV